MSEPITMHVDNGPVNIGAIRIIGITSSASLLIGDTEFMTLYSYFDTPPESVVYGPLAPLPEPPAEDLP